MSKATYIKGGLVLPRLGAKSRQPLPAINEIRRFKRLLNAVEPTLLAPNGTAVVMTLSTRPVYTEQVLSALSSCYGVERFAVIMCVEPVNQDVIELARAFSATKSHVTINEVRLGCEANTKHALEMGFYRHDRVILIEDDTLPSPDALEYFQHCLEQYDSDPEILTISGYCRSSQADAELHHRLGRRPNFHPWGWATWRSRWEEAGGMRDKWGMTDWDGKIDRTVRGDRKEIYPLVSRIQNIGALGGVNVPSAEWHAQYHRVQFCAGSSTPRGRFEE